MRIKCYSVRLQSLVSISNKAYLATSFDGSSDVLPKSQVFGLDNSVTKSEAYWISVWILEKKKLQYSKKKEKYFDSETGRELVCSTVEKHIPSVINKNNKPDEDLIR